MFHVVLKVARFIYYQSRQNNVVKAVTQVCAVVYKHTKIDYHRWIIVCIRAALIDVPSPSNPPQIWAYRS
jgi:hypothetical protein